MNRIIKGLLKKYTLVFLLIPFTLLVFAVMFYLYRLEAEAFIYAAILTAVFAAVLLTVDAVKEINKHRILSTALNHPELCSDELPQPSDLSEEDLIKLNKLLLARCSELTTQLKNEKQEAVDYYSTWVHQIKTPISVMHMLLQSEDTKEHRDLSAELFRIEQYVDMVLQYSRLSSSTSDYVFKEYDADIIIRQAIRKFAPQFIRKKIKINYEPTDIKLVTDEKWLLFIIEQILSNAVKYTYRGTVSIIVSKNTITIKDSGIGISKEDLPRIFEKGFTGFNGRSDKKATGLGLYLCSKAAYNISVKIRAVSEVGKGSSFIIEF